MREGAVRCLDPHGFHWMRYVEWGETPCAFVELKEGASASAEEVIEFCRARMARFKAPRSVVFGPLPKTSTGKIQKFLLRERAKSTSAIE